MGRPKAILRDRAGRTFLERLVGSMKAGGCEAVIVVAGRHVAQIALELPPGALLVHNRRWQRGQLSSAVAGLQAALLLAPAQVLVHLIDQPLIRASDVRRVLDALARHDVAIAVHRGQSGHPIALSAKATRRIARARGESLRQVLARAAPRRVEVPGCSAGCVRGANTPAELEMLLKGR
jgi:CTP:molybdopterin cytidylyltransferase MocA